MSDVILEIGTEEIPAVYMENTLKNLKQLAQNNLKEARINYQEIKTFGTPCRIVLYVSSISEKQDDKIQKVKGPSYAIAFGGDLKPREPAIKFAQNQGVNIENLIAEDTEKGKYIFAIKSEIGKHSIELLKELFPEIIKALDFPKSMRWEDRKLRFIRPIRWLLALYDQEIIEFDFNGLCSGNITYGHKLLAPNAITISSPEQYFDKIEKNYVIIDPKAREKIIKEQIIKIFREYNAQEKISVKQLEEIVYLVEYPYAVLGKFDEKYLKLPTEVLTTVMEKHQKYFPVFKDEDKLLPYFIVIINGAEEYAHIIIKGNEDVLKARLEDAKFFYQEDQKLPLEKKVDGLTNIIFRENLGSLYNKVERIKLLSDYIADDLRIDTQDKQNLLRAVHLCKADLITEMVKEFPELQGIMGKKYAILSNEKNEVAEVIFEHYLPRFSGDILPKTKNGIILSIADKVDNIVGCFIIGLTPTGSQDPYGLRRQSLGVIAIILKNNFNIPLKSIIQKSYVLYTKDVALKLKVNENEVITQVLNFFYQRIKNVFLEEKIHYDVIDAVLSLDSNGDLNDIKDKIKVIEELYNQSFFIKVLTSANRVFNLSKNYSEINVKESLFIENAESKLYKIYQEIDEKVNQYIQNKKYFEVFELLERLCMPIDEFFDRVLVIDKNEEIKKNRLALVKRLNLLFNRIADLSKISLVREGGSSNGKY